jgi:hypothetical protein
MHGRRSHIHRGTRSCKESSQGGHLRAMWLLVHWHSATCEVERPAGK